MKISEKLKHGVPHLRFGLLLLLFMALSGAALAQTESEEAQLEEEEAPVLFDSTATGDSLPGPNTVPPPPRRQVATSSDITETIKYSAKDSIRFDVRERTLRLYGDAKIDYGSIKLAAERITIDWSTSTLYATGITDSTGKKLGYPVFEDNGESFQTEEMSYNFKTQRAFIKGAVTQQGEGYMHGEAVKRDEFGLLYISDAKYTTCNLEEPHFHIAANKIKLLPGDRIITGAFNLQVNDIPTPLGFAFGMFPQPKKQVSGIVMPKYGEERRRGFFLRDGGYYLAISEKMDLKMLGSIYSKGSYNLNTVVNYNKRYHYTGNFNVQYSRSKVGDNEEDSLKQSDIWVRWNHSPKSQGNSRFTASVSAGTSSYNQLNPTSSLNNTLRQEFNSNVSYSTSFMQRRFNFTASARQNQNVRTGKADFTLPDASLTMNRIYPFKFKGGTGKRWYEKIGLQYTFNTSNRMTNQLPFTDAEGLTTDSIYNINLDNVPRIVRQSQNGGKHNITANTSFSMLKFLTVSPSLTYDEVWYLKRLNWNLDEETNRIVADTVDGFSRAFSYRASASMNTRLYGFYNINKGKVQAIRHVVTPSVNFSYQPDFGDTTNYNNWQYVRNDTADASSRVWRSSYQGLIYGGPNRGKSGSIGLSIGNTLEMKVLNPKDTTGKPTKVPLLDNFGISTSYNLAADSFQLAPIRMQARTRILNNMLDINGSVTLDPYIYELESETFLADGSRRVTQTKRPTYAWNAGQGVGSITNAMMSLRTSLSPKTFTDFFNPDGAAGDRSRDGLSPQEQAELNFIEANPDLYVDFSIPWKVSMSYQLQYSKQGFADPTIRQTLRGSGEISLTEKWKVTMRSGYDVQRKQFTQTSIDIARDLHCWQLNFNWVPFGTYQSYQVTLNAKSSLLQDLRLNRQRSWWDN